jgi:hypothetical protein
MSTASLRDTDLFVGDLFQGPLKSRKLSTMGWGLAFALHAAFFGLALGHRAETNETERPPLEVELVPPPELPPPAPEPEAPPTPAPASEAKAAPLSAPRAAATPPPLARAGALHIAKADDNAPAADDPLDFTHDQSVMGFGAGVVAMRGTAAFAPQGAAPAKVQAARPMPTAAPGAGEALTPVADLGRKPALGEADPCRGYFPRDALDDVANASVLVVVGKNGGVSKVSVISESPLAQGFGNAARACMLTKHFTPALDREGRPTATAIRVNVRFAR